MNTLKNDKSQAFNDVKSKINFIDLFREYHPDVKLEPAKNGWLCKSPFREDKHPSLFIDEIHSFDYVTKEKLDIFDLYQLKHNCNRSTALKALKAHTGTSDPPKKSQSKRDKKTGFNPFTDGKQVAVYDYQDKTGKLLYQNVRFEPKDPSKWPEIKKTFLQRRPDPNKEGQWIWNLKGIKPVPFKLPELLKAPKSQDVFICEGEKDVLAMISLGFIATSVGSASTGPKNLTDYEVVKYFKDRHVIIVADNDGPGREYALKAAPVYSENTKSVLTVAMPGGPEINDVSDFYAKHGDAAKNAIEKLIAQTPEYKPEPATDKPEKKAAKQKALSRTQLLYECFNDLNWRLFFDQSGEPWASVKINDHFENVQVSSKRFTRLVRKEYWEKFKEGVTAPTIEQVMDAQLGQIEYTQPPFPLHVRMAWNATKDKILIDSGRPDWSIYEIGPDGWTITQTEQSPFKRARKTAAYSCTPDTKRATWDNLFEFLRVTNDQQKTIIKMWLCLALFPDTSRPGLVITGPHGSAKTTLARKMKMLVDPATNDRPNRFRRNEDDMIAPLANYAVTVLDNANQMTPEQSDLLCLSITGLDDEKRALFTDGDIHNTEFMSTWIVTGLNNPGKMGDFLSRVFLLETELLNKKDKIHDNKINELAQKYTAGIQALIFDCMSQALGKAQSIKTDELNRLAQANIYSLAMADGLGLKQGVIAEVWNKNSDEQQAEVSSGEILTELIPEWLAKNGDCWEGTPSEHHEEMFEDLEIEKRSYKKSFPVSAVHLTRRLNTIIENLAEKNIRIINKRGSTRIRQIYNTKTFKDGNPFEKEKAEKVPDPEKVIDIDSKRNPVQPTLSDQDTTPSCNKCDHYQGSDSCGYSDGLADPENCPLTQIEHEETPW
ncbi:MAG: toprim domain-containing protein [Desulfomonilaceae bacterium]